MDRHWLITWTCYGTRVSGDAHGFVANVRDDDGNRVIHNIPGTPCDANMPLLEAWMRERLKDEPVSLDHCDAAVLIGQFQETARIRRWTLQAASVMFDHSHVIVSVPGDPDPQSILETLKSWATRALKQYRPLPANGTFWTAKGSKRILPNDDALVAGVVYVVKKQPNPHSVWYGAPWQQALDAYERSLQTDGA